MAGPMENIRYNIESSESKLSSSNSNRTRMDVIRRATRNIPTYCRAVVLAYSVKDFENGFYAPWYAAHVDPEMIRDETLAKVADDYADQQG